MSINESSSMDLETSIGGSGLNVSLPLDSVVNESSNELEEVCEALGDLSWNDNANQPVLLVTDTTVEDALLPHSLLDDDSSSDGDEVQQREVADTDEEEKILATELEGGVGATPIESLREREERMVGGEILFLRRNGAPGTCCGWDSLRWLSYSGVRNVQFCQRVYRLVESEKKKLFWAVNEEQFLERSLVIYQEPPVILVLRRPRDLDEIVALLDLPDASEIENPVNAMQNYWVVEIAADPATAKLRLSALTTETVPVKEVSSDRAKSCFTLVAPIESIVLSAVRVRNDVKKAERSFCDSGAFLETTVSELAISKALCDFHEQRSDMGSLGEGITWKHQLVVGSLHSFVISGNQSALEDAIVAAIKRADEKSSGSDGTSGRLPGRIVDAEDDSGLTALFYACSLRMCAAVSALIRAGANTNVRVEGDQSTLLHVCARNLDDASLSVLLANGTKSPNPNSLTTSAYTPMYVAAIDGRSSLGIPDAAALQRCLTTLKTWGGELNSMDVCKVLAVAWRHQDLVVVLEHSKYHYPLPTNISLSAFHCYPLHHALLSMLGYFGQPGSLESASKTVHALLDHGFEPNERVDLPIPTPVDFPIEFVGCTPLQVLASVAIDLNKSKELLGADDYTQKVLAVADLAELIVRMGGRISLDTPPITRLRHKLSNQSLGVEEPSSGRSSSLSICSVSTRQLPVLLGGEARLDGARKCWINDKSVGVGLVSIMADDKSVFSDGGGPGSSDQKSCAICWKVFGSLMTRKHKCRVSRRYLCDDCSTKRLVSKDGEHRISDGQFLLAKGDEARKANRVQQDKVKKARSTAAVCAKSHGAARSTHFESDERNRESLFGGILEHATNYVFGDVEQNEPSQSDKVQHLNQSLNQTRDALNERGEKLASLDEKTNELVNASSDFARMAKELRKKSEGGLFW
jgi:hypothetical protein